MGAVAARIMTQTIAVAVGCYYIYRNLGFGLPILSLCRIMASAIISATVARSILMLMPGVPGLACGVLFGAVSYGTAVRYTRSLDAEEIRVVSRPLTGYLDGYWELGDRSSPGHGGEAV